MGAAGNVGKIALALGIGGLGVLTIMKGRDDQYVERIWHELEQAESGGEVFSEEMVANLPEPAKRYFLHAIRPGTRLASRVHFGYAGEIRTSADGPWMPLNVEQILVKDRGFVWKAMVWRGPILITGADHYLDGEGRMRIALFGLVPVVNASGPDLSKSAQARLVMEGTLLPTSMLPASNVTIEGLDESRFSARVNLNGETIPITFTVDQDGRPREISLPRWGDVTDDRSYRYIPYGVVFEGERSLDGYTIPSRLEGGWWYGTEKYAPVIRAEMGWAHFT